jgi:hypothetical protein
MKKGERIAQILYGNTSPSETPKLQAYLLRSSVSFTATKTNNNIRHLKIYLFPLPECVPGFFPRPFTGQL